MLKDTISVIVPIYNVEKQLDKCIDSIIRQTYKKLEIILVNDGSTDNSIKICEKWKEKDSRIKIINQHNCGVSKARNAGLNLASGEYIGFVDGDDFIHPTMYEKLIKKIKAQSSDICMCKFSNVYENGELIKVNELAFQNLDNKNIIKYLLSNSSKKKEGCFESYGIMGSVCRLLIKKSHIGKLKFDNLKVLEDLLFIIKLIKPTTKISIVNDYLYYYFQRSSSVMHNFNESKVKNRYFSFKTILNEISSKADSNSIARFKFYNYASLSNEMLKNNRLDLLKEYLKDEFFVSLNSKENYKKEIKQTKSFKRKLGYFLIHKKLFKLYLFLIKKF